MRTLKPIFALCLAALLPGLSGCHGGVPKSEAPASVRLYEVVASSAEAHSEFPGYVEPSSEVCLAFQVSGTLQRLYVKEGQQVREGQLIAQIDPRDYRLQFEAAEAEYLKVKAEAERVMRLHADSVVTADAYDKARYGLQQISAKYQHTKNQLADTKLYAPFDGSIERKLVEPPMVIAAGLPVAVMVAGDRPEVVIHIPASLYIRRNEIASATARFSFLPGEELPLRVISTSPKANSNQLYALRLAFMTAPSQMPTPGMSTMVDLTFKTEQTTTVEIPATALFRRDGNDDRFYVWRYEATGHVTAQEVVVSRLSTDGMAHLTAGLEPGMQIVTAGVRHLTEGQAVQPLAEESKTNIGGLL